MDFIKNALNNKNSLVLIILAIAATFITIVYVFRTNILETFTGKSHYVENSSSNTTASDPVEIILFSADWCPHCKVARPEWNKISEKYHNKNIKGKLVIFTDVNCTEETAETTKLMTKYGVEGYPTVKLIKDGKVIDFDAKPTEQHLQKFLEEAI